MGLTRIRKFSQIPGRGEDDFLQRAADLGEQFPTLSHRFQLKHGNISNQPLLLLIEDIAATNDTNSQNCNFDEFNSLKAKETFTNQILYIDSRRNSTDSSNNTDLILLLLI